MGSPNFHLKTDQKNYQEDKYRFCTDYLVLFGTNSEYAPLHCPSTFPERQRYSNAKKHTNDLRELETRSTVKEKALILRPSLLTAS